MSRYLLLFLLNTPFILAALLNSTVSYKMRKISKRRYVFYLSFWSALLAGLALASPIYNFLFTRELTQTEPLSLFDVVQITAIVAVMYIAAKTRSRVDSLERRVNDLHQELSIQLSNKNK